MPHFVWVFRAEVCMPLDVNAVSSSHPLFSSQRAGVSAPKVYKGVMDCAVQTVKGEGVLSLWKGFLPAYARQGPWQASNSGVCGGGRGCGLWVVGCG